jgi:DNA polymerase-3 subunit alpha
VLAEKIEQRPESLAQRLLWEKELLGIYLSGHPLDKYQHIWEKKEINIAWLLEHGEEGKVNKEGKRDGKSYDKILGLIESVKEIATKKDATKKMIFFKLKDMSGDIECVVFPKQYEELRHKVTNDSVVTVTGKISVRDDKKSIIVEAVRVL